MTFIELVPTGCFDNYGQNLPMEMMGSGPVFAVGFLNITTHVGTVAVYDRAVSSPHRPTKPFAAKANVPLKFMSGGESFTGIDLSIGL